jgi:hypothetical protein
VSKLSNEMGNGSQLSHIKEDKVQEKDGEQVRTQNEEGKTLK